MWLLLQLLESNKLQLKQLNSFFLIFLIEGTVTNVFTCVSISFPIFLVFIIFNRRERFGAIFFAETITT
jgi:hypothetical protein